jgi:hypothetical protein
MRIGNFAVAIPQGQESSTGHVALNHGQTFTLDIRSFTGVRSDAKVEIDGKHVGTWRLPANGHLLLERPAEDTGKFTCYKQDSAEGAAIGLQKDSDLGLVKVTINPEKPRPTLTGGVLRSAGLQGFGGTPKGVSRGCGQSVGMDERKMSWDCEPTSAGMNFSDVEAAGTGLSGKSDQQFGVASSIEYDKNAEVVISLRLAANKEDSGPRPLKAISPLSNPVPEPIA